MRYKTLYKERHLLNVDHKIWGSSLRDEEDTVTKMKYSETLFLQSLKYKFRHKT